MPKIALISRFDYCGSGYRMAEAINLNTYNHVQYFRLIPDGMNFKRTHPIFHNQNNEWVIGKQDIDELNSLLKSFDILHFKGDYPPIARYFPIIDIEKHPRIISVGGSFFRRGFSLIAQPVADIDLYLKETDFRTALMADLNYPEYDGVFTPHPYDTDKYQYCWKNKKTPLIIHTPVSRAKKGTATFLKAIDEINKDKKRVDIKIIENESHKQTMEQVKEATIFFDQCMQESYGNSTIAATAFGIPTITHLSEKSISWSDGLLEDAPIVNCGNTVEGIVEAIEKVLSTDMKKLSIETRKFCERVHSYKAVGEMWDKIYKGLLCI